MPTYRDAKKMLLLLAELELPLDNDGEPWRLHELEEIARSRQPAPPAPKPKVKPKPKLVSCQPDPEPNLELGVPLLPDVHQEDDQEDEEDPLNP